MAAIVIPIVTNWSVTPQNGQEDYFIKMNTWLSESTSVIASLNTAIVKINESNTQSNNNLVEVIDARDITVQARDEAVSAIATLTAGAIDDTTIATNKAFSNSYIKTNYYDKTEVYNKTEVDTAISEATLDINSLTNKPIPSNTDNMVIQETGGLLKKLSFANLINWIKSFSFGWGQTWQNLTASRSSGVTYTNTTGKPIEIEITIVSNAEGSFVASFTRGEISKTFTSYGVSAGYNIVFTCVIPAGETYKVNLISRAVLDSWLELR